MNRYSFTSINNNNRNKYHHSNKVLQISREDEENRNSKNFSFEEIIENEKNNRESYKKIEDFLEKLINKEGKEIEEEEEIEKELKKKKFLIALTQQPIINHIKHNEYRNKYDNIDGEGIRTIQDTNYKDKKSVIYSKSTHQPVPDHKKKKNQLTFEDFTEINDELMKDDYEKIQQANKRLFKKIMKTKNKNIMTSEYELNFSPINKNWHFEGQIIMRTVIYKWIIEKHPNIPCKNELLQYFLSEYYLMSHLYPLIGRELLSLIRFTDESLDITHFDRNKKRKLMINVFYSILGLVHIENGFETVEKIIHHNILPRYTSIKHQQQQARFWLWNYGYAKPKHALMKLVFELGLPSPTYQFKGIIGNLKSTQVVEVMINGIPIEEGLGGRRKDASLKAAENALLLHYTWPIPFSSPFTSILESHQTPTSSKHQKKNNNNIISRALSDMSKIS